MIGARQGAWHHAECRERIECYGSRCGEEVVGKHSGHAGILHSHFYAQSATFSRIESEQVRHQIAKRITYGIVAKHHCHGDAHYAQAIAHKLRMHRKYHASHYQAQSYNAYARHNALYLLEVLVFTQILIEEKSHNHGHEGNHKDILKHTHCVDIDLGSGKPEHQQRGHERSQKSGYGGHTHRESHITLAEETHDIARHATRAASHENNARSEIRV